MSSSDWLIMRRSHDSLCSKARGTTFLPEVKNTKRNYRDVCCKVCLCAYVGVFTYSQHPFHTFLSSRAGPWLLWEVRSRTSGYTNMPQLHRRPPQLSPPSPQPLASPAPCPLAQAQGTRFPALKFGGKRQILCPHFSFKSKQAQVTGK